MLFAFEEVMGKNGLNAVLNLVSLSALVDCYPPDDEERAFPFETISLIQSSVEQGYGPRGGRGLALRAGRVFFSHGLRTYGPELGLNDADFRFQPSELKLMSVLHMLADFFNQRSDQVVSIRETQNKIFWQVEKCPWCWGRTGVEPLCLFAVGTLQEALHWASSGRFYNVVEETCIAQGDPACIIAIDRIPLT